MISIDIGDSSATDTSLAELGELLDKEFIDIIILLYILLHDTSKIFWWLYTQNPMLGMEAPITLIARGRGHKVLRFIESAIQQ